MIKQNPIEQELNELTGLIARLRRGEFTRTEFRSHSVHLGVYTQRQPELYFVRFRVPLGILTAAQLTALADTTDRLADGECHLTTRQGVEIHNLSLDGTLEALVALGSAGLSSHESGGNTVRGIVVCPHAADEAGKTFDVTDYAARLNRSFLRHPDFQSLPRKIKIGFSCCAEDCTHTVLHDLGFQARSADSGQPGFRVMVGGGTGALPRLAKELIEFLPAKDLVIFTEAFLRMFNRLGDRQNRRRSRVKFLVESLGLERLQHEIIVEWEALKSAQKELLPVEQPAKRPSLAGSRHSLRVAFHGGNITSGQLRQLAALIERYALTLHTTPEQDFLLRDIWSEQLATFHVALREAGLPSENSGLHLTVCPGSPACSNAFTNSQALAQAILQRLPKSGNSRADDLPRIRVSGCTNGCALHVIADIGLEGLAQRREGALIPAYRFWLGGRAHQQHPRLAADLGIVPARRVADCVSEMVLFYQRERGSAESLSEMMDRLGVEPFAAITRRYQQTGDFPELMIDCGEQAAFSLQDGTSATTC